MGSSSTLYSPADVAAMFGVSANSIKDWVDGWERKQMLKPVNRTPGGHRRFTQEQVDQIKVLLNTAPSPPSVSPSPGETEEEDGYR